MNTRCAIAIVTCVCATSFIAKAEDGPSQLRAPDYLDDRSGAEPLVHSLYNAINRHEYARAWSYFSVPPAKSFDKYVAGFADTAYVDVVTGRAVADGAAGSVFYSLPVAIRAVDAKGEEKVFAGCYTLRQVNPQIQDPPYRSLSIEKGALSLSEDNAFLVNALPEDCGHGPAEVETNEELASRVNNLFVRTHKADCNLIEDQRPFLSGEQPRAFDLRFRYDYDTEDRLAKLFQFDCSRYAYNVSEVYYLANEYNEVSEVTFAEPDLDIKYTDDSNSKVASMTIGGFKSSALLVNSDFDPDTQTISSMSKWRGIGDASSSGVWIFREGSFVLSSYAVDATYDEEENPVDVVSYEKKAGP